jgi:chemotaxis response regulator CheB
MARTVLVADDNAVIRKMICQMFEREDDYDLCAEATNGQEAIALAIRHQPDLIILDLSMPIMNGLDAARISTVRGIYARRIENRGRFPKQKMPREVKVRTLRKAKDAAPVKAQGVRREPPAKCLSYAAEQFRASKNASRILRNSPGAYTGCATTRGSMGWPSNWSPRQRGNKCMRKCGSEFP